MAGERRPARSGITPPIPSRGYPRESRADNRRSAFARGPVAGPGDVAGRAAGLRVVHCVAGRVEAKGRCDWKLNKVPVDRDGRGHDMNDPAVWSGLSERR